MRILDLFCGAGGAAMGYHRAGFEVVGVDIAPQKHYPFEFHQADALAYVREHGHEFDAIHASPPCQAYSATKTLPHQRGHHPELVEPTRRALILNGKPWVMENVPLSPLNTCIVLCGQMFGLRVFRHRNFESSVLLFQPAHIKHDGCIADGDYMQVVGNGRLANHDKLSNWQGAMGIDWMPRKALTQAIPPAYTEYIGRQLTDILEWVAA